MSPLHLVCVGDSLTTAINQSGDEWSRHLARLYTDNRMVSITNFAISGQTLIGNGAAQAAKADATFDARKGTQILSVWFGTNDIYTPSTGVDIYAAMVPFCKARMAVGFKVIIVTITPETPTTFETQRQDYNGLVRDNWKSFAHGCLDLGADPVIGQFGQEMDETYYQVDHGHLNTNGRQRVASLVKPIFDSLL